MSEQDTAPQASNSKARLLEANGLAYAVGGRDLVSEVALDLDPGTVKVIIGPNGAGKSTLLRLLCGELRATRGSVTYADELIERIPAWRLAGLRAMLPQSARLAFPFSVAEVARIGLDGIGRGLTAQDKAGILQGALMQADVAHLSSRTYESLSGGEQARAQFARILCQLAAGKTIASDQILFLDEPTASLDLRHQCAILDVAMSLSRQGVGVLAILHDLNLAAAYADELLVMDQGRIVERGRPASVLRDDIISSVFGVRWPVSQMPPAGQAFILPRRDVPSAQQISNAQN